MVAKRVAGFIPALIVVVLCAFCIPQDADAAADPVRVKDRSALVSQVVSTAAGYKGKSPNYITGFKVTKKALRSDTRRAEDVLNNYSVGTMNTVRGASWYSGNLADGEAYIAVEPLYRYKDVEEMENAKSEAISKAKSIVKDLDLGKKSQKKKVALINRYLMKHTKYSNKDRLCFSGYSALVRGYGNCAAYSEAFCMIAKEAGLKSLYITGKCRSGKKNIECHAWNRILVDKKWYNVDVTWNDVLGEEKEYFLKDSEDKCFNGSLKIIGGHRISPGCEAAIKGII